MADMKWLCHNCSIIGNFFLGFVDFVSAYLLKYVGILFIFQIGLTTNLKRVTRRLIEFCKKEIHEIELCHECYKNANESPSDWFVMVCSRKHPVVWARVLGGPYEPAKVMKINDKTIDVSFFGAHSLAKVENKFCFKFTKENPNKTTLKRSYTKPHVMEVPSIR